MASVPQPSDLALLGVPSYVYPGVFTQVNFAQGQSGLPTQVYSCLLMGNLLATGSIIAQRGGIVAGTVYGPDTLVPCSSVNDCIALCGAGSSLALAYAAFKAKNPNTPLYICPVARSGGTRASQVIQINAIANGPANSSTSNGQTSGVIQYQVDGKAPAQAVFGTMDTAITIAQNLSHAINSNVNLPVSATSALIQAGSGANPSVASLTITANTAGARGNCLRGFPSVDGYSSTTPTTTYWINNSPEFTSLFNSPAFFGSSGLSGSSIPNQQSWVNGAGSDLAGYQAALAVIAASGQRYYYIVCEAGWDSIDGAGIIAGSGGIQSFIDQMSTPAFGLRCRGMFGSVDSIANTATTSTDVNDPRLEAIQCANLDLTPFELAATWAGAVMVFETTPLSSQGVNFDNFGGDPVSANFWNVPAPLDGSSPSNTNIQTAVISGFTPLKVVQGGKTVVVKRITSYFFTPGASQPALDLRITDAGWVTITDRFFDDLSTLLGQRFPRMMIGTDTPSGAPPSPAGIVTVSKVANVVDEVLAIYASAGLIDGPNSEQGVVVQQNQNPTSTIGITVPLYLNSLAHCFLVLGNQVGPVVI